MNLEEKLFDIHTHADACNPEEVVYKHDDVLNLIKELEKADRKDTYFLIKKGEIFMDIWAVVVLFILLLIF